MGDATVNGLAALVGILAFVGGLAVLALRFGVKAPGVQGASGSPVRLLRSVPIGRQERVALIAYRGEVFLLGVAQGSVTLLARMDEEPALGPEAAPAAAPWLAERFKSALASARRREAGVAEEEPVSARGGRKPQRVGTGSSPE